MILHGVPTFSLHPMPRVSHGFAGFYAPVHEPASDGAAENPPEAAGPLAKQAGEPRVWIGFMSRSSVASNTMTQTTYVLPPPR